MRLTSIAHLLVKYNEFWVGFNEFGKYIATYPYIKNEKLRRTVVQQAMEKVKKLELKDG
jgi:hypothetical protein